MTIRDISEATRIRQTVIRAIENDDFSICGGDFYARGHVRMIANVIGIDSAPLLAEFDAARLDSERMPMSEAFEPEFKAARPQRRGPNWTAAMAVALAVVVILGLARLIIGGDSDHGAPPVAVTTSTAAPSAAPSARPSPAPTKSDAVALADRVVVRLTASGASWVSVRTGSGKELFEGTLDRGDSMQFTDRRRIRLVVGNAGVIRLNVNGEDVGAPGRAGEVVRIDFEPGDPDRPSG